MSRATQPVTAGGTGVGSGIGVELGTTVGGAERDSIDGLAAGEVTAVGDAGGGDGVLAQAATISVQAMKSLAR
jgi:hypothetical protein